jgi:hypothetical protein
LAVEVARAAGERQRAVDDPDRGLVDERLGRLDLGEHRREPLLRGPRGRRRVVLVDQQRRAGQGAART